MFILLMFFNIFYTSMHLSLNIFKTELIIKYDLYEKIIMKQNLMTLRKDQIQYPMMLD